MPKSLTKWAACCLAILSCPALAADTASPAHAGADPLVGSDPWGFLDDLVGKRFKIENIENDKLFEKTVEFSWEEPGKVIREQIIGKEVYHLYELSPDKRTIVGRRFNYTFPEDMLPFVIAVGNGSLNWSERFADLGMTSFTTWKITSSGWPGVYFSHKYDNDATAGLPRLAHRYVEAGAQEAAASLAIGPLTSYPQDGSIPTIQLGQEAAGYIQNSRKFRRMAVPVPVYKFTGRRGQRICARADSTDGNARVHIGRLSKDAVSPIWSGILPWDTLTRNTGSSVLVTLPDDGDYYIYAEIKPWSIGLEPNRTPLSSGRYELKLWDAERAEPPSVSPIMATRPYPATDGDRLGHWEPLANPHVGVYETLTSVTKNPDGSFIHRVTYLDGGLKEETHYFPTGQRGVYRSAGQRVAEIQCDGSVIVYLDQSRNRFELTKAGGGGTTLVQTYALQRPAQVYAAEMSRIGFPSTFSQDTLWVDSPYGRRQAMEIADLLEYGRREEERGARERAAAMRQRDQEMGQAFGNALGRVAGAYAEAAADNDRMRRTLDDATARGLAEGNAIRRQREAEEARRQGELAGDQADRRRAGAENAGLSREQQGSGPGSSTNGQPGLTIADRREPAASPQAPAEPETRQTYAWCMALRPNQNVTYSTVQQITIPNYGWSDSSMAQDFGAVAGGGVSVCSNTDSRAAAQAQLDGSKAGHRGIKQTTTSAILRP